MSEFISFEEFKKELSHSKEILINGNATKPSAIYGARKNSDTYLQWIVIDSLVELKLYRVDAIGFNNPGWNISEVVNRFFKVNQGLILVSWNKWGHIPSCNVISYE